jgi:hypothetical protein
MREDNWRDVLVERDRPLDRRLAVIAAGEQRGGEHEQNGGPGLNHWRPTVAIGRGCDDFKVSHRRKILVTTGELRHRPRP